MVCEGSCSLLDFGGTPAPASAGPCNYSAVHQAEACLVPEIIVGSAAPHSLCPHLKGAANYDLRCNLVEDDLLAWGRMVEETPFSVRHQQGDSKMALGSGD